MPPAPEKPSRGRPPFYTDRLMLMALVIMIIRRLYSPYALLAFLQQDDFVIIQLRDLLKENGKFPSRRTWERRLGHLPDDLPGLIGCLGQLLTQLLNPWIEQLETVSLDSTALRTGGGVWHKKDRLKGIKPHTSIDCEAEWGKSGWHGWWYGWKLHLAVTSGRVWIPVAAEFTTANAYDGKVALSLLAQLSQEVLIILGDKHYSDSEIKQECSKRDQLLVTLHPGPYPHKDKGVEWRRDFHKQRSQIIEPFNGLFKSV